jgi:hypothetical protein
MGFASGSVSFKRFKVLGKHPKAIDEKVLDKLEAYILQVGEYGVPEEVEYGWSGGRHIFDQKFTFERNVFAEALHFALRIDTNRVPGDVKKAYQLMEEDATAAGNPSGFISKKQKQDVKETVKAKLDEDLKSGKFRRSKLFPILWDFPTKTLYTPISGTSAEKLLELFERTFELQLEPVSAGTLALEFCEAAGKRREYEDTKPTRFVLGPEGESQWPEYPWVAKGPRPKDFFGDEFLLWLWHEIETRHGTIKTESGEVAIVIDKSLELECAYGISGKDGLRGDGPTHMPEAQDALRSGKVPRKLNMLLETGGITFDLGLAGENFAVGSAKFPDVEEADNDRTLFEERIAMLRNLSEAIDGIFDAFLKHRIGAGWEGQTMALRKWIMAVAAKHAAA